MNIPKENVYERIDASWKDMEELDKLVNEQVKGRTKILEDSMGICGVDYEGGILWKRAKEKAMAEDAPDDHIIVSSHTNLT